MALPECGAAAGGDAEDLAVDAVEEAEVVRRAPRDRRLGAVGWFA